MSERKECTKGDGRNATAGESPRPSRRDMNRRRMRWSVVVAVLSAMLLLVALVQVLAQPVGITRRFPPYPDVWGVELPNPRPGDRRAIISVFAMPDGEIAVLAKRRTYETTRANGTCCDFSFDYSLQRFFDKSLTPLSRPEQSEFVEQNRLSRRDAWVSRTITLTDGTTVETRTSTHPRCFSHGRARIVVTESSGSVVRDAHLLYLRDVVANVPQRPECEGANGASYVRARIEEMAPTLVSLDDGTFIASELEGAVVIRFDRFLKSKFLPHDRIFLVDRREFEAVYDSASRSRLHNQTVEDALIAFLLRRKRAQWSES